MTKRFLPLLVLPLLLAGCAARFTNLTPQTLNRTENNLYPVEMAFKSRQESLRWDSIQAFAVVGADFYPMNKVALMQDRWETAIPVPPGTEYIHYHFKVDYLYNSIKSPRQDSAASPSYLLRVKD